MEDNEIEVKGLKKKYKGDSESSIEDDINESQ